MGLIRAGFIFTLGTVWGVYLAQNYNVPDAKRCADEYVNKTKHIEETYRKPNNALGDINNVTNYKNTPTNN